jgi:hypothetical protein
MKKIIVMGVAMLAAVLSGCGTGSKVAEQAGTTAPAETAASAAQETRKEPAAAARTPITIPQGTQLKIRTTTALSTNSHKAGDSFQASLSEPLVIGTTVIAPKGATVKGIVASSDPGGRVKGRASIGIRLTAVEAAPGEPLAIETTPYVREAPGTKKQDAVKVGVGSGAGAAIGAIAGGGTGAAIGAIAGAGAGTGVVLATRGAPATIASESVIAFRLRNPVTVARSN